jgi:hypothetical protein
MAEAAVIPRLRPCTRCQGQLVASSDAHGEYMACLGCGAHSYPGGVASPMTKGENHARMHRTKAHWTD